MIDLSHILNWWVILLILGVISVPLSIVLFNNFFDKGYGLSKTLTLLLTSYVVFLLSVTKILAFEKFTLILVLVIYAVVNIKVYLKNKSEINKFLSKNFLIILFEDLLFSLGLFFWVYVRAHQPDINGLEKFMDFGFVNTTLRSKFLPPTDMWAAGLPINYYWYGHYVTAFLIKLTSVESGVGYNLMLGTILGTSLTSTFSLVSSLLWNKFKNKFKVAVIVGGLLSAILLNFAGNFHTPFYILKEGVNKYWYPDATRFIGYNPDVPDKTIHEFPIYSYVVSDLHAHLLNVPFVILFLSLLYLFISSSEKKIKNNTEFKDLTIQKLLNNWLSNINNSKIKIFIGFLLGVMFMTNAWDIANYLLVAGFVFLISSEMEFKKIITVDNIFKITVNIITIILVAVFTVLPFVSHFQSIAQGVALTHTKTPVWQLAILWGFPAFMSISFVLGLVFIKKIKREDRFILGLLIASWTLIALPEFIYVKDIYAATHYRANTMFKLTYQAFVMFYLSGGYIAVSFIKKISKLTLKLIVILIFSTVFASILYYPFLAVKSYYGKLTDPSNTIKNLTGDGWLESKYPDTYKVVKWLRANIPGQPVILEAPGDSYTEYDVISSYTGLPTISGWYVHEWLWRGTPEFPQKRVDDITNIYTTDSPEVAKVLLNKYLVKYVIVGSFEKEKFPSLKEEKFLQLGKVVYSTPTSKIYKLN